MVLNPDDSYNDKLVLDYYIGKIANEICYFDDIEYFIKDLITSTKQENYTTAILFYHLDKLKKKYKNPIYELFGNDSVKSCKLYIVVGYIVVNKLYDDLCMINIDYLNILHLDFALCFDQSYLNELERAYLKMHDYSFNHEKIYKKFITRTKLLQP